MRGFFWVIVCTLAAGLRAAPTFYKDVLPVLQRSCQTCHCSGEAAPMPLLTYEDTWAKAIRQAALTKKMPPWFADPAKEVPWRNQSWEEMMAGAVEVAIDVNLNPMDLYRPKRAESE